MHKIYYIDTKEQKVKVLHFIDMEDLIINYPLNLSKLEPVGKIKQDIIFKVKNYNDMGFMTTQSDGKYYGDFIIARGEARNLTSSMLSIMDIYYHIEFFAQPALELARILRKKGYCTKDKISITVKGRDITTFISMLLKSFKIYPPKVNLVILEMVHKYKNNYLNLEELFVEIFLYLKYYFARTEQMLSEEKREFPALKIVGER